MKTVIAGLEEGLNAIADALEGGGSGGGGNVPTPTLDDDGKVLKVVSQSQEEVAPEWSTVREVPTGGQRYQVLTKTGTGNSAYGWANAPTPEKELPAISSSDSGKLLQAWYDSEEGYGYTAWGNVASVPNSSASDSGKVLTCTGKNKYGWAPASGGGGGHIDVLKIDLSKSDFSPSEVTSGMYDASVFISGALTKIDNMINISVVDNVDSGTPTFRTVLNEDECSIFYDSDMTTIRINSTIYNALGTRQATHFYLTYYTGA